MPHTVCQAETCHNFKRSVQLRRGEGACPLQSPCRCRQKAGRSRWQVWVPHKASSQ